MDTIYNVYFHSKYYIYCDQPIPSDQDKIATWKFKVKCKSNNQRLDLKLILTTKYRRICAQINDYDPLILLKDHDTKSCGLFD